MPLMNENRKCSVGRRKQERWFGWAVHLTGICLGNKQLRGQARATVKRDETSNRLCEADGCGTRTSFGSSDDGRTRFCSTHKQEGHVNVTSKRCEADGCGKIPISAVRSTA